MSAIIIYDGYCNLCSRVIRFILKRDVERQFIYVASQSEEGKLLLEKYKLPNPDSVVFIENEKTFTESNAVLQIIEKLHRPWRWLALFRIFPEGVRNAVYKFIAKYRLKLLGRNLVCYVPESRNENQ